MGIMVNIIKIKDDIVKVILGVNIISFVASFFTYSKAFFITVISINVVLTYTLIIIDKFGAKFEDQYVKMWSRN